MSLSHPRLYGYSLNAIRHGYSRGGGFLLSLLEYNKHLYTTYRARAGEGRSWSKDTSDLQERREGLSWGCAQGVVGGRGVRSTTFRWRRRGLANNSEEEPAFQGRTRAGFTVVLERTLDSPLDCKQIKSANPKGNQSRCWSWHSNTLVTWCKELTHLERPWRWERLKVGGEGDDRGWDGWMAPPTQWTWVWVNSGS